MIYATNNCRVAKEFFINGLGALILFREALGGGMPGVGSGPRPGPNSGTPTGPGSGRACVEGLLLRPGLGRTVP